MFALGITPATDSSPEAFKTMMSDERAKWSELIQQIVLGKSN